MKFNFESLVKRRLVTKKTYGNGLAIFKYTKRVFFDNLWGLDPLLLEARGIVLDPSGEAVIWPFTKVFNHGERDTTADPEQQVQVVGKVNGFMASVRYYKGEVLVASTGTMDSEYVTLARNVVEKHCSFDHPFWHACANYTLIFEICDESDPHIVDETPGAYLIGARNMSNGKLESESMLDFLAGRGSFMRPARQWCTFAEAVKLTKECKGEGFMIRDDVGNTLMKIKSPHYLTKKALMRIGTRQIEVMFSEPEVFRERLDEEFYGVFEVILAAGKEAWAGMSEVQRREYLEDYFSA